MRRPFAYSLILHLLIVVAAILGLPSLRQPPVKEDEPVIVDLVAVTDKANPPPAAQLAPKLETAKPAELIAAKPEPRPEPPQAREEAPARTEKPMLAAAPEPSPPPPPEAVPKPEPKTELRPTKPEREPERPQPKPEPKPEKAEGKVEPPKPERKTVARAEPEAELKVEPRPQAKPKPPVEPKTELVKSEAKLAAAPERKPEAPKSIEAPTKATPAAKPPEPAKSEASRTEQRSQEASDFAAVSKAVQDLRHRSSGDHKSAKTTDSPKTAGASDSDATFTAQVAEALRSAAPAPNKSSSSSPVSSSEIDAVRRQIERCWNLPETARDVGNLIVSIRVEMNVDGTPRTAVVENAGQMQANPHFQAAADSARRAVLNPRCHPFRLPPEKFEHWQTMTLIFNPKDIS